MSMTGATVVKPLTGFIRIWYADETDSYVGLRPAILTDT